MTQLFISYSRKDLSFVRQLVNDLKNAGFEVWYDVSGIRGGTRWRAEIESAVRNSQFAIVILSPDSIVSEWVEREFLFASKLKRKIIPLYYRECELPLNYLDLNYIDVRGDNYQKNFNEILSALNQPRLSPLPLPTPKPSLKSKLGIGLAIGGVIFAALCIGMSSYLLWRWINASPEATEPNILVTESSPTFTPTLPIASETPTTPPTISPTTPPTVSPTIPPTVTPTDTLTAVPLSDLFISSLSLNPSTPAQGSPVAVSVQVSNQGIGGTDTFVVQWWPGENYTEPGCTWQVDGLAAGDGTELTCTYAGYPSWYGSITTKVTADSNQQVGESDEGNNTKSMAISVSQPASFHIRFDSYPNGSTITGDQFLNGDEFLDRGIRLAGAPEASYCSDATVTAIRSPGSYVGLDFYFLTSASPGEINRCNSIPVAIIFTNPVYRVTLTFAGASVTYTMNVYDSAGNLIGTEQKDAVLNGGTSEVTFTSSVSNISRVTFGRQAAVTAIKEIEYEP